MSMTTIPVLATLASLVLIGWLYIRLTASRARFEELNGEWRGIEPRRYAPMARLLAAEDFIYLRSLPGYEPRLERELRRRRLEAFRQYLADLTRDFDMLQRAGQVLAAAGQASPLLREQLFLAKVAFTRALWQVRLEMALFRLSGRAVETRRLLSALQDACGALAPAPHLNQGAV